MVKCKNCRNLTIKTEECLGIEVPFDWCLIKHDNTDVKEERKCIYYRPKTNADRIRSMTDEELAKFLEEITCESHGWCDECKSLKGDYCHGLNDESNSLVQERLEWLKSEVGCE